MLGREGDRRAGGDFGGLVARRAGAVARERPMKLRLVCDPRETEVGDAGGHLCRRGRCRVEVAMDHARRVRGCQPRPGRLTNASRSRQVGSPPSHDLSVPRRRLHREKNPLVELSDVVNGYDVRVGQARHRLRLALHPETDRIPLSGSVLAVENLNRERSIQMRVERLVDRPRRAAPDDAEEDDVTANHFAAWNLRFVSDRRNRVRRHRSRPG